ncbi:MAG: hypothetical protein NTV63_05445 [Candidatus Woesearchaeota archaeon]|nr:hypothetical protein [Candidatus Woesearchaeota archaeon]
MEYEIFGFREFNNELSHLKWLRTQPDKEIGCYLTREKVERIICGSPNPESSTSIEEIVNAEPKKRLSLTLLHMFSYLDYWLEGEASYSALRNYGE